MDVRLKSNVIYQGAVLPVGAALCLSDEEASDWVKRGLAEAVQSESVKTEPVKAALKIEEAETETTEITETDNSKKSSGKRGRSKK